MRDWLYTLAGGAVLAVLLRAFVIGSYIVPSESMAPTIVEGDRVIGEKLSLHGEGPVAGDIITFDDPEDPKVTLIKRVIATEGQTVDLQDGYVLVDGVQLDEPYVHGKPSEELLGGVSFPYQVPEGHVWVMGDNRTNSYDSRGFGAVPVSSISSRALCIWWPGGHMKAL